jgi:hypothetical protein
LTPCRVEAVYQAKTGFVLEENSVTYKGCPQKKMRISPHVQIIELTTFAG